MSADSRELIADRGDAGQRLDLVLVRRLGDVPGLTRTRAQIWIENHQVSINGRTVQRSSVRPALGDRIVVNLADTARREPMIPEDVALDVLYEDDGFIAINKPAGIVVHPTFRHADGTLMNALLWRARAWPAPQRPSLIGRLDRMTTGILLVAKTRSGHAAMQRVMSTAAAAKDYLALVYGRVNAANGRIAIGLARDPNDRRRVVACADRGVESVTLFERLARLPLPSPGLSLLRCRLVTGRTHQIRVHLAARGFPIVGDAIYGEPRWKAIADRATADALRTFGRQALHAWRLSFIHPVTGRRTRIEAPVPADIDRLLTTVGGTFDARAYAWEPSASTTFNAEAAERAESFP